LLRQTLQLNRAVLAAGALVLVCALVAALFAASWSRSEEAERSVDVSAPGIEGDEDGYAAQPFAMSERIEPSMGYPSDPDPSEPPTTTAGAQEDTAAPVAAAAPDPALSDDRASHPESSPPKNQEPPAAPAPSQSPTPAAADDLPKGAVRLSGQVRHAVWGTPLAGVSVRLSSGAGTVTDDLGNYAFPNLSPGEVVAATISGAWLSYDGLSRIVVLGVVEVGGVDFVVYPQSEASGRAWRSAAEWRGESPDVIAPIAERVAAASTSFAGLTTESALSTLEAARNGSLQERATGELLASWMSLAYGELGFDTPVDVSATPGAVAALGADPETALDLVRQSDLVIAEESDPDWNRLRRVLGPRSLVD